MSTDIVASMTNMHSVKDDGYEAIYSTHNLEHLYAHELEIATAEFLRVLKPIGFIIAFVPDLQIAAAVIVGGHANKPL